MSVSVAVSVLTLTFISVDRWYAICHPLRFKSTASRARAAIAVIWVVSAALGIPEAAVLDTRPHPAAHRLATLYLTDCAYTWRDSDTRVHQLCVMVALFVVPLLLMSYLYYKMVRVLWRKEIPGSATTTTTTTALQKYDSKEKCIFTCVQKERQGIMEFVTELKHLAQECEFENLTESLIRDRLIIGILDREVKIKLLEDPQLTLPRAISIAMISESTCSQVASLNEQKMIEKIEKRNWVKDTIRMENAEAGPSGINPRRERIIELCKWCGQRHKYGKCPAYGKKCNACGKTNHFSVVCRTKRITNLLADSEAEESCDQINLNEVAVKTVRSDKWSATIIINGKKTTVHLDTGAQINVLPHKVINQWPPRPEIRPTSLKAFAYGNTELPIVGKCNVLCQYGKKKGMFEFIVADVEAQTLITGDTCEKLEILRRINHINTDEMKLCSETQKILEQYHEVFQGVGLINSECKIYTKPEYSPVQVPPRRIPTSLGAEVQSELEKMVKQGIVTKIYHETEWYHPMTPAPAELLHEIPKAKYYTVLDVKSAYWHIPVAKKCRDLLVRFLGHLISQNGIDPEPNKIDKLITFKRPEDKKSLQRIMGLYNYLGKFIPNLAASTSNIRGILRKNVVWHWGPKQDREFDHIKECVRNAPSLAHFDKSKMLILQCDASKDAMGAALLQEDRPLAFASASFSDSQKQYSQIEKELLSVYFGCKKFEYLLSGHTFVVQTDHQPLLPLVKKPLSDISPRLQRLVMKLIAFDFKLQYKPGKYLIVADTLSRDTHPMDELPTPFLEDKRMVKMVRVNISDEKLVAMQKDTREDPALVKVIDYVIEGWPICKKDVDEDAKVFFDFRHRLYLWNDLLCIGSAIVIPKTQRNNMLNLLHQSHQGISAIQGLARESLFWPRMSIDIAEKPLKPFPVPDYPWQTVSLDIFYIQKKPHLLVVDRYSGYPEVFTLDPPTAINVKNKLRETFARFGIPETMMSDNGPPFRSEIMTDFCIRWGIKQLFSSPHLHRSNGLAERNIQTIKNQLIKCRDEGSDPYLAILAYRNTPKNDLPSPAQLCLSRSLRCQIPRITPLYRPYQTNWRSIENAKRKRQSSMKEQYDRNSKSHPKVNVGEDAWCQIHPRETWTPVKISAQADSPQSFEVVTPSGNRLIRNQQFIRPRDGGYEKSQLSSEPITGSPEAQHPQCDSPTMGESSTAPIQRSSEETNIDQREGATTSAGISPEPSGRPRCMEISETLHWTRQQQQYSIHTQDREHCDCCDRDAWRYLRLFIGQVSINKPPLKCKPGAWTDLIFSPLYDRHQSRRGHPYGQGTSVGRYCDQGTWTDLICSPLYGSHQSRRGHPYGQGTSVGRYCDQVTWTDLICSPLYGSHQSRRGHPYGQGTSVGRYCDQGTWTDLICSPLYGSHQSRRGHPYGQGTSVGRYCDQGAWTDLIYSPLYGSHQSRRGHPYGQGTSVGRYCDQGTWTDLINFMDKTPPTTSKINQILNSMGLKLIKTLI
ncbi:K02A2.6-like [Cordylochernes scorpioides]|uniref:K02A2.6-like n=1 Tax=Cordylochernes scorpioides TaxID=51811 RepID=A0ABY6KK88_9ARAC|nr:K02A2.6-like [Cordylochernes scorpioides]